MAVETPDEGTAGNVKVTRADWLGAALEALVTGGIENVKVLDLGTKLGVSRSSFYWYFRNRQALLEALLEHWQQTNTAAIVAMAEAPAATITEAVCNVFRCVIDERLFDNPLDFAIRDWARRAPEVKAALDRSDGLRLEALAAMFERFGYPRDEAFIRARVLYFMQVGYDLAELDEPTEERLRLIPMYLYCFTGRKALPSEIEDFEAYAQAATKSSLRRPGS